MTLWWLTTDFIYGSILTLFLLAVLSFVVYIINDSASTRRLYKRQKYINANPVLLSCIDDCAGRNLRAAKEVKYKRPLNLNDFEYEIQNLLALKFGSHYPLYFYKEGRKYKLVFDETERMVQEVEGEDAS